MIEKEESRRMRGEIRHVLMNVWDPIGINDQPACADEYDSYLAGVLDLLMRREDDNTIAKHLAEIVTYRMDLSATAGSMLPTVRALRAIRLAKSQ
jgi:hypothetical protein